MSEKRLGELSEQDMESIMDGVIEEEFDQISVSEFFATLGRMDAVDAEKHVVVNGHLCDGEFVPHRVEGAVLDGKYIRVGNAQIEIHVENPPSS